MLARTATLSTIALFAAFASSCLGLGVTRDYEACFGLTEQTELSLHLVEVATPTGGIYIVNNPEGIKPNNGVPSCAGFDGIAPGASVTFSDVDLASRVRIGTCSLPLANVSLPNGESVTTARKREADEAYAYRGGISIWGPTTVGVSVEVAGCRGEWILSTYPTGLASKYPDHQADQWADDYLYDPLAPGDDAPVIAMRRFVVEAGTTCAALPMGAQECVDVYSGYHQRAP